MLALVELTRLRRPLEATLCAMCQVVSSIAAVDVVSVYLREGDVLVMRGNVGFPPEAVGRVQLGANEGLTGVVAERRRAVTVAVAQEDARYKHVDGIGEEQFAAYLGVPLLIGDDVEGVLVMQRREPTSFSDADVSLATSLTAAFILVVEREGARGTTCVGKPLVAGRASGPAAVVPATSGAPASEAAALHALEFDHVTASQRLGHAGPAVARALDNIALVATALRERLSAGSRGDVLAALERVPYRTTSGDLAALVAERHREIHELWAFLVADMQHALSLCGAVLVVPHLGAFVALEAVARGAVAVIAGAIDDGAREILEAAALPAVAVPVASVRRDQRIDVDGTTGSVRVR